MEHALIIKEIRSQLGLSQKAFAEKLHLSFSTINRWENGRVKPNRLATVMVITVARENGVNAVLIQKLEDILNTET